MRPSGHGVITAFFNSRELCEIGPATTTTDRGVDHEAPILPEDINAVNDH